ncbi:hypothetical protein [Endozoicomonas sp. SCSIO W0465]|uniref:hypothetical protein n=1 Tax=Endozoicomonas sp. SCSIO W0465 TaxID=2918516 RepID=UPI0020763D6F|nr:hypothetical protein [Endozoicomonas sp. SCSIO W0465]USE33848.1 hypothetical protein MJO57_16885 [Endozoicomonas sp. SCSIO W0465]
MDGLPGRRMPIQTQAPGKAGVHGRRRANAEAFRKNAEELHNKLTKKIPDQRQTAHSGKDLSSRKIAWIEKVKHHLNIFACNFSLKLHLYLDNEGRQALIDLKKESKAELQSIKLKQNVAKVQENMTDGQYGDAARGVGKAFLNLLKIGKYQL